LDDEKVPEEPGGRIPDRPKPQGKRPNYHDAVTTW